MKPWAILGALCLLFALSLLISAGVDIWREQARRRRLRALNADGLSAEVRASRWKKFSHRREPME